MKVFISLKPMRNHAVLKFFNGYPVNNCLVKTIGRITFQLLHTIHSHTLFQYVHRVSEFFVSYLYSSCIFYNYLLILLFLSEY